MGEYYGSRGHLWVFAIWFMNCCFTAEAVDGTNIETPLRRFLFCLLGMSVAFLAGAIGLLGYAVYSKRKQDRALKAKAAARGQRKKQGESKSRRSPRTREPSTERSGRSRSRSRPKSSRPTSASGASAAGPEGSTAAAAPPSEPTTAPATFPTSSGPTGDCRVPPPDTVEQKDETAVSGYVVKVSTKQSKQRFSKNTSGASLKALSSRQSEPVDGSMSSKLSQVTEAPPLLPTCTDGVTRPSLHYIKSDNRPPARKSKECIDLSKLVLPKSLAPTPSGSITQTNQMKQSKMPTAKYSQPWSEKATPASSRVVTNSTLPYEVTTKSVTERREDTVTGFGPVPFSGKDASMSATDQSPDGKQAHAGIFSTVGKKVDSFVEALTTPAASDTKAVEQSKTAKSAFDAKSSPMSKVKSSKSKTKSTKTSVKSTKSKSSKSSKSAGKGKSRSKGAKRSKGKSKSGYKVGKSRQKSPGSGPQGDSPNRTMPPFKRSTFVTQKSTVQKTETTSTPSQEAAAAKMIAVKTPTSTFIQPDRTGKTAASLQLQDASSSEQQSVGVPVNLLQPLSQSEYSTSANSAVGPAPTEIPASLAFRSQSSGLGVGTGASLEPMPLSAFTAAEGQSLSTGPESGPSSAASDGQKVAGKTVSREIVKKTYTYTTKTTESSSGQKDRKEGGRDLSFVVEIGHDGQERKVYPYACGNPGYQAGSQESGGYLLQKGQGQDSFTVHHVTGFAPEGDRQVEKVSSYWSSDVDGGTSDDSDFDECQKGGRHGSVKIKIDHGGEREGGDEENASFESVNLMEEGGIPQGRVEGPQIDEESLEEVNEPSIMEQISQRSCF